MKLRKKFIGDKAFYKMLLGVAFPIMVQNGMSNFVNLLDNLMVGRLGTEQMSGVAIVNQFIFIFYLLLFGGLSGVGIFTAQYFGSDDYEGIRKTFRFKMWLGFVITVVTAIVLLKTGESLIQLYLNGSEDGGNLEAALMYGETYLGWILLMLPPVFIGQLFASTLRECGETFVPMVSGVIAVFTNLIFNYILIFGKFGAPAMGVKGAALATIIARCVEAVILIVWSFKTIDKHPYFKGLFSTVKVPLDLAWKYLITSMPILVNEGLWSIGIAMLGQAYSIRGLNVVAGQNIANTINNLFNIVFIAMGDAVAIIIGQYLGSGDMKKARDTDNKIIATAVLSSIFIGLILFCTSGLFPKLYNTNDMARLVATHFLMVQAAFMPKDAFLHTTYFTIRAGGKTIITFLFDSVFMMCVSVPVAYYFSRYTSIGPASIFAIVHGVDIIKCVIGFILVKKGVWMKNLVKTES
ncbi:MAG: MATE family efflux transporter [Eubacterium sp.]|nr:MATE family efflux transporter [Eubacterium sp.]